MRHSFLRIVGRRDKELPLPLHIVLSFSFILFIVIVALLVRYSGFSLGEGFDLIVDLSGGVAGSLICFILPSVIYLKLMPPNAPLRQYGVAMLIFGIAVLVIVPTLSIVYFT